MSSNQELSNLKRQLEDLQRLILEETSDMKHNSCPQCPFSTRADRLEKAALSLNQGIYLLERLNKKSESPR